MTICLLLLTNREERGPENKRTKAAIKRIKEFQSNIAHWRNLREGLDASLKFKYLYIKI